MNFFEQQDRARRRTKLLVVYFVLAVALIVVAINLVVAGLVVVIENQRATRTAIRDNRGYRVVESPRRSPWRPEIFAVATAATLLVIGGGTGYKLIVLSQGGRAVAAMFNATPLPPNSQDPDHRKLQNVVEEMSIASGLPVPAIYVMEDEEGINAFAAGFTPQDAVIAVTRGCMEKLNRDELQGVVAHEFSHILNGDMRMDLRLVGVLNGILIISLIGYGIMRSMQGVRLGGSRRGKDSGGAAFLLAMLLLGAALFAIGYIGLLFGRLIQAAVSRQREFLADASAVQFTRNPNGIAGALKKIGGYSSGSRVNNSSALAISHMFFATAQGFTFGDLFATHPPIVERIKAIDPSFDGQFPPRDGISTVERYRGGTISAPALAMAVAPESVPVDNVINRIGNPRPDQIQWADDFLSTIPAPLINAAHEPFSARVIIFGLLSSRDPEARQRQTSGLCRQVDVNTLAEIGKLTPMIDQLPEGSHLSLLELSAPALRQLSPQQAVQFQQFLKMLIEADGRVSLFEYALHKVTNKYLPSSHPGRRTVSYFALKPLLPDAVVLLGALAAVGSDDVTAIDAAFRAGSLRLDIRSPVEHPERVDLAAIDQSLDRLSQASPAIKQRVMDACAHTVAADGMVGVKEAELLRAIASTLDCPLPPMLGNAA